LNKSKSNTLRSKELEIGRESATLNCVVTSIYRNPSFIESLSTCHSQHEVNPRLLPAPPRAENPVVRRQMVDPPHPARRSVLRHRKSNDAFTSHPQTIDGRREPHGRYRCRLPSVDPGKGPTVGKEVVRKSTCSRLLHTRCVGCVDRAERWIGMFCSCIISISASWRERLVMSTLVPVAGTPRATATDYVVATSYFCKWLGCDSFRYAFLHDFYQLPPQFPLRRWSALNA
jgi:hypothetical protein